MAPFGDGVGLVARSELRRHWRALMGLAVVTALVGAVSLSAFAGARRTATSLDRFRETTLARDARVTGDDPARMQAIDGELDDVPQVEASALTTELFFWRNGGEGLTVSTSADPDFTRAVDRPLLLEGRLPDPDAADEIAIDEATVRDTGLGRGDRIEVQTMDPDNFACALTQDCALVFPDTPLEELRVTGVFRDVDALVSREFSPEALGSAAFYERYGDRTGVFGRQVLVRMAEGQRLDVVEDVVGAAEESGALVLDAEDDYLAFPSDAVDVLGVALLVFALTTALAGGLVLLQTANRHVQAEADDAERLRELGAPRRGAAAALALTPALAATAGALVAIAVAVPASTLFPFGIGRRIEPDPGVRPDALVLLVGALLLVVVVAGGAFWTAWRQRHPKLLTRTPRPSTLALVLARVGADPAVIGGARLAFEHRPRQGTTLVRSALVATILGASGLVASALVATSLDDLIDDPARWGWNWDSTASPLDPSTVPATAAALGAEEGVAGVAVYRVGLLSLDGEEVAAHAMQQVDDVRPTLVEGRVPTGDDEIALGLVTQRDLGVDLGDTVVATDRAGDEHELEIVGTVALPAFQDRDPGVGSFLDGDTWDDLSLSGGTTEMVVRYEDGVDVDALEEQLSTEHLVGFRPSTLPSRLDNLDQSRAVLPALAAFFAAIGLLGLLHALLTAVRERRAMLAMLRLLGSPRRSVRLSVVWQAEFLMLAGLAVGIPLGFLLGRTIWHLVIRDLGVVDDLSVEAVQLALLVPAGLLAALLVSLVPAWIAARRRIAAALQPA